MFDTYDGMSDRDFVACVAGFDRVLVSAATCIGRCAVRADHGRLGGYRSGFPTFCTLGTISLTLLDTYEGGELTLVDVLERFGVELVVCRVRRPLHEPQLLTQAERANLGLGHVLQSVGGWESLDFGCRFDLSANYQSLT